MMKLILYIYLDDQSTVHVDKEDTRYLLQLCSLFMFSTVVNYYYFKADTCNKYIFEDKIELRVFLFYSHTATLRANFTNVG